MLYSFELKKTNKTATTVASTLISYLLSNSKLISLLIIAFFFFVFSDFSLLHFAAGDWLSTEFPALTEKTKTKQKDQQDIFWSRQDGWARSQNFNPRLRFTRRNRQAGKFRRTSLFSLTATRLHCTLSRPITDAISQCLLFSCWQKVHPRPHPPNPDLAVNTTSPSTWRPFAIIRVNTRPKDMEGSGGLAVLKKPECQNVTRLPAAGGFDMPAAGWCPFDRFIRKFARGVKEVPYVCAAAIRLNYSCQKEGELSRLCAPHSEWP